MFVAENQVRMHDTDMAGILYFARQFRFVHDTLEDLMESEGLNFDYLFHKENFVFVIVHAEADYFAPVKVGDRLEIQAWCESIGTSSFTMCYIINKRDGSQDEIKIGSAKTVHVTLDTKTRKKIPIPKKLKDVLKKYVKA
jgi:1,4-dihydroxy-2-naphthoyl-CoA hydrolase